MKRVLLIEIHPSNEVGGAETYNRKLLNILHTYYKNVEVDEVTLFPPIFDGDKVKKTFNKMEFISLIFQLRKKVDKLINHYKYDLIIDSTTATFKKIVTNENYIWIQHLTPQCFSNEVISSKIKRFIYHIIKHMLGIYDNFYHAKNIVFYDKFNYEYVKEKRSDNFTAYLIALSSNVPTDYMSSIKHQLNNREKIIYFGRINNEQKNIAQLIEINSQIHLIDFYGVGDPTLISKMGEHYKGYIDPTTNPMSVITKYKYMILLSNWEGFSYSLVQSLSYGLPIIVRNSFLSAPFLVNNNKNGFLLDSNLTTDQYANEVKKIYNISLEKYLTLCENAYEFASSNLDNKIFIKKWLNIFKKYLDE